jgi:hypothetical protein
VNRPPISRPRVRLPVAPSPPSTSDRLRSAVSPSPRRVRAVKTRGIVEPGPPKSDGHVSLERTASAAHSGHRFGGAAARRPHGECRGAHLEGGPKPMEGRGVRSGFNASRAPDSRRWSKALKQASRGTVRALRGPATGPWWARCASPPSALLPLGAMSGTDRLRLRSSAVRRPSGRRTPMWSGFARVSIGHR